MLVTQILTHRIEPKRYTARAPEPTAQSRTHASQLGVFVHPDGIDVAVTAALASQVEFCAIDFEPDGSLRETQICAERPSAWRVDRLYPGNPTRAALWFPRSRQGGIPPPA